MTHTLFWLCMAIVIYTYLGYAVILWLAVCLKRLSGRRRVPSTLPPDSGLPEVTLIICAYNEEDVVDQKMTNCMKLDYPADKLHVMWVTDGSDDRTNERLAAWPQATVAWQPERKGKTSALNRGIGLARTDIVVMTDANTCLNSQAIRETVRQFQDPTVGCVAGEKRVVARNSGQTAAKGEGLYWRYESTLKRWDSELYSAMGAAGELCAVRRKLYEPMPSDTLLDDFIMSMKLLGQGYRIAYTPDAYAMEYGSANLEEESKRKRRIAAGGLQSIWRLRGLMNPLKHPLVAFQFISHRVLRWSVAPFALLALVPLNVALVMMNAGWLYTAIWILQILFYLGAWTGLQLSMKGTRGGIFFVAYYFLFMNLNVFRGISYLYSHKNSGNWEKAKRG